MLLLRSSEARLYWVNWGFASNARSAKCGATLRSRCVMLLVLLCAVRIGEASHPGPEDANFVLGAANPSGLRSKAPYVVSQMAHGDLWAFTETHLCSRELQSFNAGLIFAKAPFHPLLGGFPVPVRHIPQD